MSRDSIDALVTGYWLLVFNVA